LCCEIHNEKNVFSVLLIVNTFLRVTFILLFGAIQNNCASWRSMVGFGAFRDKQDILAVNERTKQTNTSQGSEQGVPEGKALPGTCGFIQTGDAQAQ
jgi:hypothetical protein